MFMLQPLLDLCFFFFIWNTVQVVVINYTLVFMSSFSVHLRTVIQIHWDLVARLRGSEANWYIKRVTFWLHKMATPKTDITRKHLQRTSRKTDCFRLNTWKLSREYKTVQHALLGKISQFLPRFKHSLCFYTYLRLPLEMLRCILPRNHCYAFCIFLKEEGKSGKYK